MCYNLRTGGLQNTVYSEEHRNKLSESLKGIFTGDKNPMYGKHLSEETKRKISESLQGEKTIIMTNVFLRKSERKCQNQQKNVGKI